MVEMTMLINHSISIFEDTVIISYGGGNCFSFGTHFNHSNFRIEGLSRMTIPVVPGLQRKRYHRGFVAPCRRRKSTASGSQDEVFSHSFTIILGYNADSVTSSEKVTDLFAHREPFLIQGQQRTFLSGHGC